MVNEEKLGTCEKHRRYYEKATKLYFKDGLGYRRISKIIPVAVTTLHRWCVTFARANGIDMERKVKSASKSKMQTFKITDVPNDIKYLQAVWQNEAGILQERRRKYDKPYGTGELCR